MNQHSRIIDSIFFFFFFYETRYNTSYKMKITFLFYAVVFFSIYFFKPHEALNSRRIKLNFTFNFEIFQKCCHKMFKIKHLEDLILIFFGQYFLINRLESSKQLNCLILSMVLLHVNFRFFFINIELQYIRYRNEDIHLRKTKCSFKWLMSTYTSKLTIWTYRHYY